MDYSNKSHNNYYYFDNIPKNYYFVGDSVSLKSGYSNKVPASPMPWVMKADGSNNMNELKTWFSTEGSVKAFPMI